MDERTRGHNSSSSSSLLCSALVANTSGGNGDRTRKARMRHDQELTSGSTGAWGIRFNGCLGSNPFFTCPAHFGRPVLPSSRPCQSMSATSISPNLVRVPATSPCTYFFNSPSPLTTRLMSCPSPHPSHLVLYGPQSRGYKNEEVLRSSKTCWYFIRC